jgi:tripartite-type tricarboxylate transporter receptor subunit TctC
LPDVPTFEESGVKGYEASGYLGLMVPAGTPAEPIARLREAAVKALAAPDLREKLTGLGVTPAADADVGAFLRSEIAKWREVLRVGNITPGS